MPFPSPGDLLDSELVVNASWLGWTLFFFRIIICLFIFGCAVSVLQHTGSALLHTGFL